MKNSFISFAVSILVLVASGCNSKSNTDAVLNSTTTTKSPMKYLALGDSYTIGQSVDLNQNFPHQLVDSLKLQGISIDNLETIARTGWTTDNLQNAITQANPQGPYDLVTLLIGVNNQYRGYDTSAYVKEFEELLQQSIKFAGNNISHVFVLSIPDYGCTPFGASNKEKIGKEIDLYNAIALKICAKYKVQFFDITPISRQASNHPELVASDGLHPSALMYSQWIKLIYKDIAKKVKH